LAALADGGGEATPRHTAGHSDAAVALDDLATRASGGVHPGAAAAAALAEFRRIEAQHEPRSLPEDVLAELDLVLDAADRVAERLT
jgi:hypothetical protein